MVTQTAERRKLIDILVEVASTTGIDPADIIGPKRRALFVEARSFFAHQAKAEGYRLIDIGEALGGRSHSVVSAYLNAKEERSTMNKEELRKKVQGLTVEEKKALVSEIADSGTKEERDTLAEIFSGLERSRVADVETGAARGKAHQPSSTEERKKANADWWDGL